MGGLGVLIILVAYTWFAIFMVKWACSHLPGIVAFVMAICFLALPFVDSFVGREVLKVKCSKDGTVVINESFDDIKVIGEEGGVFHDSPTFFGYQYVEGGYGASKNFPLIIDRAELDPVTGYTQIRKNVKPEAIYVLSVGDRQDSAYFFRTRTSVIERLTGREIAAFDWFVFRGGWAERVAMAFSDAGLGGAASCGSYADKHAKTITMLHSALRPSHTVPSSHKPATSAEVKR